MKKLLLSFCALLLINYISFGQIIQVQITQDTLRACSVNSVTADFIGTGSPQYLTIRGALNYGNNSYESCGKSPGVLVEILSLKNNHGTPVGYALQSTDTINAGVEILFSTTDTCVLTYRIHIDCAVIPTGTAIYPIYLNQFWTDSTSSNTYNLNGTGTDSLLSLPVKYPRIINVTNLIDSIGYREQDTLEFHFLNTGTATANMSFRFFEDASDYCGAFNSGTLSYKINTSGSPVAYISGDTALVQIPVGSTLIIFQAVEAINCLSNGCTPSVSFLWRCNNSDSLGLAFCDSCFGTDTMVYSIQNRLMPELVIERVLPIDNLTTNFDVSCPNSLSDMRTWVFNITTTGEGALDSAVISFQNYGPDHISSLGLIPDSTIHIDTNCVNCTFQMILGQQIPSLCSDSVPVSVDGIRMILTNFGNGDTVRFQFQTFRCVEEDTLLYNVPKHFTNWTYEGTYSKSRCGVQDVSPTMLPAYLRNSIIAAVNDDVHLKLIYTPTTTDLTVPKDSLWGDSTDFEVKMNGLFLYAVEKQLLGCNYIYPYCTPNGYFRVTVECDSGLRVPTAGSDTRIRYYDSTGTLQYYYPEYYYVDNTPDQCLPGSYVYYFNLNDPDMMRMIYGGNFQFRLQACCGGQNGARKYKVTYDWLINPSGSCNTLTFPSNHTDPALCSGTNCEWLPLSFVGDDIVIHCPGCVTPGIVIRSYRMERSNYGYKDSDNDGFADNPFLPIDYNSPSYLATKNDYGWLSSSFGDELIDYQVAELSPGDAGTNGYTYPQMQANGAYLNYLQLNRSIRAGLDTMKVQPDTVTLYIDYPFTGGDPDSCIDCGLFNISSTSYHTQRILKFYGAALNQIMVLDTVSNQYFYTFSSFDNGVHQGILHGSDTIYNSNNHPYLGFFERQLYRMSVHYNVCGNFKLPRYWSGAISIDDIRKQGDISNKMWMSGDSLPMNAWSAYQKNPADTSALNLSGWYFPPNATVGDQAVNQAFADSFLFNCENMDGVHYFYSQVYDNISNISHVDDCTFKITTGAYSNVAANQMDPYSYEYHPSAIQPRSYTFTIPSGYQAVAGVVGNEIYTSTTSYRNTDSLISVPATGTFTIQDSSLNKFICLQQGDTVTGKRLYYGDTQTARYISVFIQPVSCDTIGFSLLPAMAKVSFEGDVSHCMGVNAIAANFNDSLFAIADTSKLRIRPNDIISHVTSVDAQSNRVCFSLSISNPLDTFPDNTMSTMAPNYFIIVPDTLSVSWLRNWTYYSSASGTIQPQSDRFLLVDTALMINEIHTGDSVCASFVECPPDSITAITFVAGWSCSQSLSLPFDTSALCQFQTFSYLINALNSGIELSGGGSGNTPQSLLSYTLCDTLFYECCFKSTEPGEITPSYIELPNLPLYMGIADVSIRQGFCDSISSSVWLSLPFDSLSHTWPISVNNMIQMGYTDSVLNTLEGISVRIGYFPDCHFIADSLPPVILHAMSYCNEPLSSSYPFSNTLTWDDSSKCNDCFTLNKTASVSTVSALDTMSFIIEICATNQDSGFVYVDEILPANFNLIGSIPWYFVAPPIGCDTVVVSGYFSTPGSCDDNFNTVRIRYSGFDSLNVYFGPDTLIDSACVTVGVACVDTNTIIFLNNDSSHNYLSTYSNATIYVEGLFTVDVDLELINCIVFMAAGSQIIISSSISFNVDDSTQILGCDSMWQGILMEPGATIQVLNGSKIKDANKAIQIDDECEVYLRNAEFYNNITGVYSAPNLGNVYNLGAFLVTGTTFSFTGSFLPNYIGQPSHGVSPYAGIDLTDVVVSIGESGSDPNHFLNMNFGIKGFRSSMEVANCEFQNIYSVAGYSTKLMGTAIVSVGDVTLGLPGNLSVLPISSNSNTIFKCERGVYASYSDLVVSNCKITDVNTGVECTGNILMRRAMVVENIITARKYGIRFYDNAGAMSMSALFNSITISGSTTNGSTIGTAISVMEKNNSLGTSYDISYNAPITLIDANAGIELSSIYKPKVGCNNVLQKIGAGQAISTIGIDLKSCVGAQVSNNIVKGYSVSNISRIGISTAQSTNTTVNCNLVDSTGYGFYFGGLCPGTQLKGNSLINHYEGLHLNNVAIIGLQTHLGNKWYNPDTSKFDAVNLNWKPTINLSNSLLTIDPNLSQIYQPKIPTDSMLPPYVYNSGWVNPQSGSSTFQCPVGGPCMDANIVYEPGDAWLLQMIAHDSVLTSEYIEESQEIAQQYLYDYLMVDSALRNSNSTYQNFVSSQTALNNLYQACLRLSECTSIEDSSAVLLMTLDSILNKFSDSIHYYNQAYLLHNDNSSLIKLENMYVQINYYKSQLMGLIQQLRLRENALLLEAGFYNSQVYSQELPTQNQAFINQISVLYQNYGLDSIEPYQLSVLAIAQQCPYQGGKAVYEARFFISLFNDSITYDDNSVCLGQGIFKMNGQGNAKENTLQLEIKPNPSKDLVEIKIVGIKSDDWDMQIIDLDGRALLNYYKINFTSFKVNTSTFSPGVYIVKVKVGENIQLQEKLIIIH